MKIISKICASIFIIIFFILINFTVIFAQSSATKSLQNLGKGTEQSNFAKSESHPESSRRTGVQSISSVFLNIGDYFIYVTSSIAVLYLIIAGVKILSSGDQIEDEITKQKKNVFGVIMGLIVIVLADEIVFDIFFGKVNAGGPSYPGEAYNDTGSVELVAKAFGEEVAGIYNAVEMFVVYGAILAIIISGFRMVAESSSDEAQTNAKKHLFAAAAGLILIGLAEGLVYIFYPSPDEDIRIDRAFEIIINITQFITGIIALVSVSALIYAGYLYIFFYGQDDMIDKSKKIIKTVIYGLILVTFAYAIVYTFITLQHNPQEIEGIEFKY
ncbi:hypothetical protein A2229_05040 [Candidatus Peregrinibacteria bacterium RIFOXYA2_FULL_33_7]|nr:MAG: hypothetical protein A2229_05040 [Candidatus Peregrinibacteria bacterium RIFOXYA2_FULL_33_7]